MEKRGTIQNTRYPYGLIAKRRNATDNTIKEN
jgi:hypothetical protein